MKGIGQASAEESEKSKNYKELQTILSAVDEVMKNTALLDHIQSEEELERVLCETNARR